ncbi:hypothetical protein QE152_g19765 [Popillia japonica]|uniref:Uncharacterized protein n=1 Tax=Popillia japonica TaxID=7064 RepID=A0AAW1KPK3_POPJA
MNSGAVFCLQTNPVSIYAHLMDVKKIGEGEGNDIRSAAFPRDRHLEMVEWDGLFAVLYFREIVIWRWWSDGLGRNPAGGAIRSIYNRSGRSGVAYGAGLGVAENGDFGEPTAPAGFGGHHPP